MSLSEWSPVFLAPEIEPSLKPVFWHPAQLHAARVRLLAAMLPLLAPYSSSLARPTDQLYLNNHFVSVVRSADWQPWQAIAMIATSLVII